jgi:hypothetical protein
MTVKDLIKKLQQYQQFGQIAAVRIEFGDGSIYNDPRRERWVSTRPAVDKRRGKFSGQSKQRTANYISSNDRPVVLVPICVPSAHC